MLGFGAISESAIAEAPSAASGNVTVTLTGQTLSLAQGTITAGSGTTVPLTGQSLTLTQGTPSVVRSGSVALTGQTLALTQGTVATAVAGTVLVLGRQPGGSVSGVAFTEQPIIYAIQPSGALDTGASGTVTASKFAGGGSLSGTTTATMTGGIATFSNLVLTGTGNNANIVLGFALSGFDSIISGEVIAFVADGSGAHGGYVPASFDEGDYLDTAGGHQITTPFAEASWITTATSCDVYWRAYHGSFSGSGSISIYVDGAFHVTLDSGDVDGNKTNTGVSLPSGSKRVTFVNGGTNGGPDGSVLDEVVFNAAATRVAPITPVTRVLGLGDSIMVGCGSTAPSEKAYGVLLRVATEPRSVMLQALSGRSFYSQASDPSAAATYASSLKRYAPTTIIFGLLANDSISTPWANPTAYGTAVAAFLDQIHADLPLCRVICLSTLDTGGTYPTAMGTACSGRSWVTFLDMQATLSSGDYSDGLHLNNAGHVKVAAALGALIGQSNLTGQTLSLTQGSVTVAIAAGTAITGQSLSLTQGTVGVRVDCAVALTGQALTLTQGSPTASAGTIVTLTGQSLTLTQGTLDFAISAVVTLVGQTLVLSQGAVGTAYGGSVALAGQTLALTQGAPSVTAGNNVTVSIVGQSLSLTQGSVVAVVDATVSLSGQALTLALGIPVLSWSSSAALTGQSLALAQGVVTTMSGDAVATILTSRGRVRLSGRPHRVTLAGRPHRVEIIE